MSKDIWVREKVKVKSVYWQHPGKMKINWLMLDALFGAYLLGRHVVTAFVYEFFLFLKSLYWHTKLILSHISYCGNV